MRQTKASLMVLRMFLEDTARALSGADISKRTGVGAGTIYPLLARLEAAGWARHEWEDVDPRAAGRPRKRLYRLTGTGMSGARKELADLDARPLATPVGGQAWAT